MQRCHAVDAVRADDGQMCHIDLSVRMMATLFMISPCRCAKRSKRNRRSISSMIM